MSRSVQCSCVTLALLVAACAPADARRFALRAPVWQDPDTTPVTVACRREPTPKDPAHVSCAPAVDPATLYWDGADNLFFRPLAEMLGVVAGRESIDVNSLDEVPDSSWFENRLGVRPVPLEELRLGYCAPALLLDGASASDGSWVVDKGKGEGSTDGFRVNIPGKGKYLFKADDADQPERPSAAQDLGAKVLYAAGYPATCEQIVYFRPSALKLAPGLTWRHNFSDEDPFDQRTLDAVLAHCPRRGGLVRMEASAWVPGYPIGGFRYFGTRGDDPNDRVPHEDRRELRGLRLLDAWLDRHDERAGNTLDTWSPAGPGAPERSPGHVVHNHLDTSECLGSGWAWEPVSRRLGYSYVLDWGDVAGDFVTFGARRRPWDTAQRRPGKELFGFFNVENFVPDEWKNEYPVAAFSRMTERDGAWMARILSRFTPEMVRELARMADFSDPENTRYLSEVLEGRLQRILERYLTRLSPLADVRLEGRDRLCAVDLAERRGLRPAEAFRFRAWSVEPASWLGVERRQGGGVCIALPPHGAPDGGPADDAPERYVRVKIADGVAAGPLVAHLYDLGPARGFRLAGLERPAR